MIYDGWNLHIGFSGCDVIFYPFVLWIMSISWLKHPKSFVLVCNNFLLPRSRLSSWFLKLRRGGRCGHRSWIGRCPWCQVWYPWGRTRDEVATAGLVVVDVDAVQLEVVVPQVPPRESIPCFAQTTSQNLALIWFLNCPPWMWRISLIFSIRVS
jgi:hypothetical protein